MRITENPTVNNYNYGITMGGLLQVALIVLKLLNVIDWNWGWVLAPLWIPWLIIVASIIIVLIVIYVQEMIDNRKKHKK